MTAIQRSYNGGLGPLMYKASSNHRLEPENITILICLLLNCVETLKHKVCAQGRLLSQEERIQPGTYSADW